MLARVEELGIGEALITDISKDGAMRGPSFALYRSLRTKLRIIASGGVSTISDVVSLGRIANVSGCVIGRALLDRRIDLAEARARVATPNAIPERVIPCLDVRDGRVVKGVNFVDIRDAGDPVECAMRYEAEGADELVILDISATDANRTTALDTVRRVSESLFIPLTVGGGVRTIEDFRALLRAGADRVAINTAALRNPQLIADCAREFGVQAVVLSCDAKRTGDHFEAMVRSGKESSGVDAVEWCRRAEELGTGEILLTSVDRDGTNSGYDIELLRAVTSVVKIGVIASGGAGNVEHFRDAIEAGGARAVLAASLFHDRRALDRRRQTISGKRRDTGPMKLTPAIIQDARTGEVLTLAYMNDEVAGEDARDRRDVALEPLAQRAVAQGRDVRQHAARRRHQRRLRRRRARHQRHPERTGVPHRRAIVLHRRPAAHARRTDERPARPPRKTSRRLLHRETLHRADADGSPRKSAKKRPKSSSPR